MKDSKAVRLVALAYDEGRSEGFTQGYAYAQSEYEDDLAEAEERASSIELDAYDRGYTQARAEARDANNQETLAKHKSRAYEEGYAKAQEEAHKVGYQRGLAEGRTRGAEGSDSDKAYAQGMSDGKLEEEARAKAYEPKLSVWFKPCGPSPKPPEAYPPGINKINGIRAIREAYDRAEGYGLKEVKYLVEIEPGTRVVCGKALPQSKAVTLYLQLQAAGFDPVLRGQE